MSKTKPVVDDKAEILRLVVKVVGLIFTNFSELNGINCVHRGENGRKSMFCGPTASRVNLVLAKFFRISDI